jgi:Cu(I)/Ag(I) efflux system membrane protein CusA/SilA
MAAPVLGGLLIADEVIDVFLPVLYFAVQKRRWAKVHRVNLWNGLISTGRRRRPVPSLQAAPATETQERPVAG